MWYLKKSFVGLRVVFDFWRVVCFCKKFWNGVSFVLGLIIIMGVVVFIGNLKFDCWMKMGV